jgi:hypothetical protein
VLGKRIGFRHLLEGHGIGVHPDPEHALLPPHRGIVPRPFQRDDHVVLADRQEQFVGIGQRSEDGQVGSPEVGGNGDLVCRRPDLQPLLDGGGLPEGDLRDGRRGGEDQAGDGKHAQEGQHQ